MKKIILEPRIDKCVETLAKERYWSLVNEYTRRIQKEGIHTDLEMEIEALRFFLEEMNPAEYRRKTEALMEEGRKVRVVLERSEEGKVGVSIESR